APNKTSSMANKKRGSSEYSPIVTTISRTLYVPVIVCSMMNPASIANPPDTVMSMDFCAPYLDFFRWYQKAMSRKDEMLVNSQKTYSTIRLSEKTTPSMTPMNMSRYT